MKYEVSQKLFAFGDDFGIKDEFGQEKYYVDGKAFGFGKQLSFQDEHKQELAFISQQLFRWKPTFHIKKASRVVGSVKRKRFSFRPHFVLDVPGPDDYEIVGDFIGHEYTVNQGRREVARVSKRFFSMSDAYGVDIKAGDPVLILSLVIIIDLMLHNKKSAKS